MLGVLRNRCLGRGGAALFLKPTNTSTYNHLPSTVNHRNLFSFLQVSHIGDYFTSKRLYEIDHEEEDVETKKKLINKGDVINLHDLLFTQNRDYLVRYQDNQQVKAEHLEDKPSLQNLLASPLRDYLISNNGDKTPIHSLEDKLVKLEIEKVNDLKLELLWDLNTVFRRKDGSEVLVSQLAGKNVMVFLEPYGLDTRNIEFLKMLKERWFRKGGLDPVRYLVRLEVLVWASCPLLGETTELFIREDDGETTDLFIREDEIPCKSESLRVCRC
ncbi:hypothetical protein POM88_048431 [Heracleum sosnowskyi]|uniref:Uncharacterized protein n=1 Tax=Heracleum sosnowskyi TaxID=360622 RepID=A0AAD8GTT5_9APIA|nr:hypothetical protein POM88_048431 [Heracleum sosnowskyi]